MPLPQQQPGQLQEFLGVLRRRIWQVSLPALIALAVAMAWAELLPRQYKVHTEVEVRNVRPPIDSSSMDADDIKRDTSDARIQLKALKRVRAVIEELQWDDFIAITDHRLRTEYVEDVLDRIDVTVTMSRDRAGSTFLAASYTDTNPQRAEQFLNRLRDVYLEEVVELYRTQARRDLITMKGQEAEAEEEYITAEHELKELKRQNNLPMGVPSPWQDFAAEPVWQELIDGQAEHRDKLQALDSEQSRLGLLREDLEQEPEQVPRSRLAPGVSLREEIALLQTEILRFKQSQKGLKPAHSTWKRLQKEIGDREDTIRALQDQQVGDVEDVEYVANPKRDELYSEIQTAEQNIGQFEADLAYLQTHIEMLRVERDARAEAQATVNELTQKLNHAKTRWEEIAEALGRQRDFVALITGPEVNPFDILREAQAPLKASSPQPMVIRLVGLLVGLGLGIGLALLSEYGRQGFRGPADISRALAIPVLGAVNRIVTRAEVRRTALQRAAVGFSSVVLIGAILWITWAWKERPDLLDAELIKAIEDLRMSFR